MIKTDYKHTKPTLQERDHQQKQSLFFVVLFCLSLSFLSLILDRITWAFYLDKVHVIGIVKERS